MNQLTFGDGTFAGKSIRTTSDGYASIYDVIRVAGVGRDPFNVWTELKRFPTQESPRESPQKPRIPANPL